jgi:hypothetical protein
MDMKKGFGGLLMLSVFMLGFVLLFASNSPRIASNEYNSMVAAEIHSDRIAIARNVLIKSYEGVDAGNRAVWENTIEGELARAYGLNISIDTQEYPVEANITDPSTGMSTSFFLLK